ncbi:DNA helicase [Lentibacillus sp. JNUCC-1]|uniref:replicative DNA helicase n=1 Tax=Lentibacillus sp. JNUCC-1 TaxID=2654513 RepID=UPI001329DBB6|nr:replicative DNA helicase [Lentibacillus sp. JNUCC-1]MUV38781.1 DNA helicase [Lentibacillus sp. JNUCC-1]
MMVANYEAEAAVLGAVLIDGALFKDLEVQEEHFSNRRHQVIYRAMVEAAASGEFIDLVVVTTRLGSAIQQVGGTEYLLEMAESVPSTAGFKHHEQLIFAAYRLRKSRECAIRFSQAPNDGHLDTLITDLQTIRETGAIQSEKTTYEYLLEITDEMVAPPDQPSGCMTAYQDLDEMTGGMQQGDLIIVAARPSVGKTAFALNLAAGHCKNGGSSLVFSLEMSQKPLLHRIISAEGSISGQKWRDFSFSKNDYQEAFHAVGKISEWDLAIYDQKHTIMGIIATIRKQVHDNPDGRHLIIIDYLQLITPASRRERRDLEVGEITRELKLLAIELNIPIILLSQLSRSVESRQNKRPLMSDLRESGNIEQDADVIFFLYREDYYEKQKDQDRIEVIISKQRNGPTGVVKLGFLKEFGRFVEVKKAGSDRHIII